MTSTQIGEDRHEHDLRERVGGRQPYRALDQLVAAIEAALGSGDLFFDTLGGGEQSLSHRRGQPTLPTPALEQHLTDALLERVDPAMNGGRIDPEQLGRARQAST